MDERKQQERAASKRVRLSKRVVDALQPGEAIWDSEVTGFGVRRQVRDASFVVKYSFKGRQRFYTIGRYGRLTVDDARLAAKRVLGIVATGVDPAEVRDHPPAVLPVATVSDLCRLYLAEGPAFKPGKRPSSWDTDRSNITRHILPLLGNKPVETLTEADIVRFVADVSNGVTRCDEKTKSRGRAIVEGGRGIAGRCLAVLGAAFRFGIRAGYVVRNPTQHVRAQTGEQPGRFLTREEWLRVGEAMQWLEDHGTSRAFTNAIRLLALTGCRRSEIARLRWEEVDLERGVLHLATGKTGPRIVPLSDQAVGLLRDLGQGQTSAWVFPSNRGSGPIVGLQKVWVKLRSKARLDGVRLHDLRHSFASQAVNAGASLYLTGAVLGHRQARTTQRYAHLQTEAVRRVATDAADTVAQALIKES
ncbi:tyrosine-type recombinase/integrase [Microvirga sp. BT688]|uniref:tyrosine-type recombinase/integrase n=1 Tax=Microvirga sp. TaxID=1873136 RepID=UPI001688F858|nr:tyrosine-type recombinase/integrase [Microvirga sp.]